MGEPEDDGRGGRSEDWGHHGGGGGVDHVVVVVEVSISHPAQIGVFLYVYGACT